MTLSSSIPSTSHLEPFDRHHFVLVDECVCMCVSWSYICPNVRVTNRNNLFLFITHWIFVFLFIYLNEFRKQLICCLLSLQHRQTRRKKARNVFLSVNLKIINQITISMGWEMDTKHLLGTGTRHMIKRTCLSALAGRARSINKTVG